MPPTSTKLKLLAVTVALLVSIQYFMGGTSVQEYIRRKGPVSRTDSTPLVTVDVATDQPVTEEEFVVRIARRMRARRLVLTKACQTLNATTKRDQGSVLVSERYKLAYCAIAKSGCTNMKRLLWVLNGKAPSIGQVWKSLNGSASKFHKTVGQLFSVPMTSVPEDYVTVIIVRHPFERLLSCYREKMIPRSGGRSILFPAVSKTIHNFKKNATQIAQEVNSTTSFEEFVDYLSSSETRNRHPGYNVHWMEYETLCAPCSMRYDVIAHIDTIDEDIRYLLELIGAPADLAYPAAYTKSGKSGTTNATVNDAFVGIPSVKVDRLHEAYRKDFLLFGYD